MTYNKRTISHFNVTDMKNYYKTCAKESKKNNDQKSYEKYIKLLKDMEKD